MFFLNASWLSLFEATLKPCFVDTVDTPAPDSDQKQLQQPGAELGGATGAAPPGAAPG